MKAIIILVLLLILFGGMIGVALYIRARVRRFSKEIFGTEDITQSAKQMRQEYAATPKSVSAMTSLLLPKIVSDFPDFAYDEMKGRANNVLTSYLRAVDQNDVSLLQDGNQELKNQLENHIEGLRGAGEREERDGTAELEVVLDVEVCAAREGEAALVEGVVEHLARNDRPPRVAALHDAAYAAGFGLNAKRLALSLVFKAEKLLLLLEGKYGIGVAHV